MDERFWIEMGITALIAFGATFAGVYLAFWKERRRTEDEENTHFGQLLHGVLVESANNHAILTNIKNTARGGRTISQEVFIDTLQVALGSSEFYRKATHSLILAARTVRTRLASMNNILSLYRQAAAGGREMTEQDAGGVRTRAETAAQFIEMMQPILEATMAEFGAAVVADVRLEEVRQRIAEINRKEDERLDQAGLRWGPSGGQAPPA